VRAPTRGQCSSNAIFRGRLANAHIGLVSGHYNALANGVYDSEFVDNDHALGAWTTDESLLPPGGTFFAYRSVSRGTRQRDLDPGGTASGTTFYLYEWNSDAPAYFAKGPGSAPWPLMFDRAHLDPRPGADSLFEVGAAQGPFFLFSTITRGRIRVGLSGLAQNYAVKMGSEIAGWNASVERAPNGQLEEISWGDPAAPEPALGAPGQPRLVP
ncbi:MAG: hypothetical protein ACREI7_09380, partial [Myxococcota bacterium]